MTDQREIEAIESPRAAELILHPLRQRILEEAGSPASAAEIARRLDLPAQKVNYHVKTLAEAGLLIPAGTRTRRNLVEKRYRASARAYVLLPGVLGPVSTEGLRLSDAFSANQLLQLAATVQTEVAGAMAQGQERRLPVPTLSMDAELRFESPSQQAAFASALEAAVTDVIGRFTAPAVTDDGVPAPGRPYRLVLGCYPLPARAPNASDPAPEPGPSDDVGDAPTH